MKKYILLLSAIIITLASCNNGPSVEMAQQAKTDDSLIKAFFISNPTIKATKDPSGLYYQVVTQGTGAYPNENSVIKVNYTCSLMGGRRYDAGSDFSSPLSGLVKAWQIGVPHVKAGGNIILYVPSRLAYGTTGAGPIPENAVLTFDIDLISFK
ncbi:FKBP-type peptidyl-prolyl cis-trans isomerase [Mucilaginibacter sp. SP1R1]|uniref:FKBP-type peptidyl-prolyl cis-trans isomerase n=1 Tax=Mucilaginibacter sp. SP1R1 TaxID=2723091 RepID=UPI0016127CFC|nr:FKBP-type peptidyl-prolyl cis-trans isomerase [Mucilaginibacter sp. SP1R1]MBB6150196.1 FKBP-type peptidyl-prolyl cis-trans isomerase FkpA [Mucilaginibacter sp. SP1R1]